MDRLQSNPKPDTIPEPSLRRLTISRRLQTIAPAGPPSITIRAGLASVLQGLRSYPSIRSWSIAAAHFCRTNIYTALLPSTIIGPNEYSSGSVLEPVQ
jgi:hypothetical protein